MVEITLVNSETGEPYEGEPIQIEDDLWDSFCDLAEKAGKTPEEYFTEVLTRYSQEHTSP